MDGLSHFFTTIFSAKRDSIGVTDMGRKVHRKVHRSSLMQAHVGDRAELVNDSLRHWKPVKVISDCRCIAVELPFPHNQSCGRVKN